MKLSTLDSFPYPVLQNSTDDYKKGSFSVAIETAENIRTGALRINCKSTIEQNYLQLLIEEDKASRALAITCLETFYNQIRLLDSTEQIIEIDKGNLAGSVNILPLVILIVDEHNFFSDQFHEEFGTKPFSLNAGAVLATGELYKINVGKEKLAPIESIFSIAQVDSVPYGKFQVLLEAEKITIQAEENTYNFINSLRNVGYGRDILLNSVYQPALMEALFYISQDDSAYAEKRWYRVFTAKCTHLGIDPANPDLLMDTQKLFKNPFNRLLSLREFME